MSVGYIDKAVVIIPFNLCKNITWRLDIYEVIDVCVCNTHTHRWVQGSVSAYLSVRQQ
jgi:hypothetical protein